MIPPSFSIKNRRNENYLQSIDDDVKKFSFKQLKDPLFLRQLLFKAGWLFCLFLVLRLIFAEGGIIDYYEMDQVLSTHKKKLAGIEEENHQLTLEIEKISHDTGYQKKLVRDHLNMIAADEFLILFAKKSKK